MKAYIYTEDKKLSLLHKEIPRAKRNTVIVKLTASAICGTDLRTYRFGSERIAPPRIIGHEGCGIVYEVGDDVEGFAEGDRVMTVPAIGCGSCRWCERGFTNMCDNLRTMGFDYDGTFVEYMEVPGQALAMGNLLRIDESVSSEHAVLAEPVACCLNGQSFLTIGKDDTVFIFGSGFIGCVHAELAMIRQAKHVYLSDISDTRLEIGKSILPNITTVNTAKVEPVEFMREATNGAGADVIITACPSGDAHTTALRIAGTQARISLFGGLPGEGSGFLNSNTIHYKEISLFGSHASTVTQNKQVLEWIANGTLNLGKYISASFSLENIVGAFESLKSEKTIKVLVKPY